MSDLAKWRTLAAKELRGAEPETLTQKTADGLTLKALYTAADLEKLALTDTLPGMFPFLRGPRATMYANRAWTIRQYAGFSTAEESNAFYKANLAGGQQGLSGLSQALGPTWLLAERGDTLFVTVVLGVAACALLAMLLIEPSATGMAWLMVVTQGLLALGFAGALVIRRWGIRRLGPRRLGAPA